MAVKRSISVISIKLPPLTCLLVSVLELLQLLIDIHLASRDWSNKRKELELTPYVSVTFKKDKKNKIYQISTLIPPG